MNGDYSPAHLRRVAELRDLMASGTINVPPDPAAVEQALASYQPPAGGSGYVHLGDDHDAVPEDLMPSAPEPGGTRDLVAIDPGTVPTVGLTSTVLCGSGGAAARGGATVTPYYCPVCVGGREDSGCLYCDRSGLVSGERVVGWPADQVREAPRPPGVRRSPCGDCAFLEGSPELDADPERTGFKADAPFFCHQGMADVGPGQHQPAAWWAGLPLGYLLCCGWWDLFTQGKLHTRRYIELEDLRQRHAEQREAAGLEPLRLSDAELAELEMHRQVDDVQAEVRARVDRLVDTAMSFIPTAEASTMTAEQRDAVRDGIVAVLNLGTVNIGLEQEPDVFDKRPERYVLTFTWPVRAVRR